MLHIHAQHLDALQAFRIEAGHINCTDAAGGEAGPLGGATAEDVERQASAVSGSDSRAASYLQQASQTQASEAAGMRAEEFTAFKEEQVKARGVEFVTKDGTYNPLEPGGSRDPNYRPKVATWGMFPRPNDISKTYGGGRTYRPGEACPAYSLCASLD